METCDLTIDDFKVKNKEGIEIGRNKLVLVRHAENNFSIFLVVDVEKPQVPGHPACCLSYYKSEKSGYEDIEKTYKRVDFCPNFPETGYYSSKRTI